MSPVEWSPWCPRTIQLPLTASPFGRLSRPRSTISQYDFHPVIKPFSPLRLGRSYKLAPEPDGSPLFTLLPLVACWRYEPREHLRPLALPRPAVPPSRLGDRVATPITFDFGLFSRSLHSGLQPPCLRFATAVTGRHARLGTRLLARLCRGRHRRRQTSTRLQGATPTGPRGRSCRTSRTYCGILASRSRWLAFEVSCRYRRRSGIIFGWRLIPYDMQPKRMLNFGYRSNVALPIRSRIGRLE